MSKTAAPGPADLHALLSASGVTVESGLATQLAQAAAAGRADLERLCGRNFLAPTATKVRSFATPTGRLGILELTFDLCQLDATAPTVQYQPDGATAETLTSGTDYVLLPPEADGELASGEPDLYLQPYTGVQFFRSFQNPRADSEARAIKITGRWGYATVIPDDVWDAMLKCGAKRVLGVLNQSRTGGLKKWQRADAMNEYTTSPYEGFEKQIDIDVQQVVSRYRRVSL
jgi:hypothetical protein